MLTVALQALFGFAIGYVLASYIESFMHEHISDARTKRVRKWEKYPRLLKPLINTYYSHHKVHHAKTYRKDHITQFRDEHDEARLKDELHKRGAHGQTILKGHYGTRLAGSGVLTFISPLIPALPVLYLLSGIPGMIAGAIALCFPPLMSHFVHRWLHQPFEVGQRDAPWLIAAFLRTPYGKAVYRNHFIHHRYGGISNFNLVLGADHVRKRFRPVTQKDIEEMRTVGMPLASTVNED